jgi:hypothetical protein
MEIVGPLQSRHHGAAITNDDHGADTPASGRPRAAPGAPETMRTATGRAGPAGTPTAPPRASPGPPKGEEG